MKSFDSKATSSFHQNFPGGLPDSSFDKKDSVVGPVLKLQDLVAAAANPLPYSDTAEKRQRQEDEITTNQTSCASISRRTEDAPAARIPARRRRCKSGIVKFETISSGKIRTNIRF